MLRVIAIIIPPLTIWLAQVVAPAQVAKQSKELPIAVKLNPALCLAPCTVMLTLTIPPAADNRWAVAELDGPEFRSTWIQLEGADAPKTHQLRPFKSLPSGTYVVRAVLYNLCCEYSRQTRTFIVKGN